LAVVISACGYNSVVTITWGDVLFLVLSSVEEAGLLSISLQEYLEKVDFPSLNLPDYISLRIGLHFGPVFEVFDPLKKSMNVFGAHVSRAARIEPIVPPGSVYASQAFAAQAAVENIKSFTCEYVGQQNLAKHYGSMPIFRITRRHF
jgi:class 3 adenylate cyclase